MAFVFLDEVGDWGVFFAEGRGYVIGALLGDAAVVGALDKEHGE